MNAGTLVVKPSIAVIQLAEDAIPHERTEGQGPDGGSGIDGLGSGDGSGDGASPGSPDPAARQTVFHGVVSLDPVRAVKEFQELADEIFVNLQTDGELEIVIEIRATAADGFADGTVRTVIENSRVLKFNPGAGFESE
ncbi:MAG: hypothetical protein EXQ69_10370 [Acidimicrobiia bacterium]|nr:hypothetical protein [Acidimicrobiia bacterium]